MHPIPHVKRFGLPKHPQDHPISRALDEFVKAIDSLDLAFRSITQHLQGLLKSKANELNSFISQSEIKVTQNEGKAYYTVPIDKTDEFEGIVRDLHKADTVNSIIPRSLLVELISQFDVLVSRLIKVFIDLAPNRVLVEKQIIFPKSISFKDLMGFSSIEAVQETIMNDIIDKIMRESHSQQIKEIEKLFGVDLPNKDQRFWSNFIEITERRNLFVHTNGLVSEQYLRVCKENAVCLPYVLDKR